MSLHTVGNAYTSYVLPASFDSIPESWKSNKSAKPIASSMQTVNVPALSATQTLGGSSIIQIPCGASAGIMMNPYLRYSVQFSSAAGVANSSFFFKGASRCATACINRLSSYVNSVQVDNIQNAWATYDCMLTNSTSYDYLSHDATLMLGAGVQYYQPAAGATTSQTYTFAAPLLGLLGSQQSFPLYLVNGTLQLQIDWASNVYQAYTAGANDPAWTGMTITNVQLIYDRVQPEEAFIHKVRSDMMQGAKYVYGYTNLASVTLPTTFGAGGGSLNLNYGLNVSSLQGILAVQYNSANLGTSGDAPSFHNNMNGFQVSLDGRLISSLALDSTVNPVLYFAEAQKVLGRLFDASITSPSINTATAALAGANGNASGGNFLTNYFVAGASAQRINEGLAFQGSPCSILNVQVNLAGTTNTINSANSTIFFVMISAFQLLIDATGSVEIVR
jgi:hypothetical protein